MRPPQLRSGASDLFKRLTRIWIEENEQVPFTNLVQFFSNLSARHIKRDGGEVAEGPEWSF